MYNWKHGKKGSGVYWLQQARDEARLNRIAQQMFDSVGRSISDESFRVNIIYSLNKCWRLVLGFIFSSNFFSVIHPLSMQQWEGLIQLLGSEPKTAGGLEFLHKYDFCHHCAFLTMCLIIVNNVC